MKHVLQAAAAAALLIASGQAYAQAPAPGGDAPAAPGAPAMPGGAMGGAGAAAGADAALDVTPDVVVAALNNTQTEIGEVAGVAAGASIQIVPLADFTGAEAAQIDAALTANEGQHDALRTAIEGNTTLMAYLTGEDVNLDDVVGIDVDGTNILVFTQAEADAGAGGAGAGAGAGGGMAPAPAP